MSLATTILSRLKACRKSAGGKTAGRRPGSASRFVTALKGRGNLSQLRRSGIFVENRSIQDFKLRRSGISHQPEYAAPTELNGPSMALATKMPLLRSYEVAQGMSGASVLATLKRRKRRAPAPAVATASWSAPAERSVPMHRDFVRTGRERTVEGIRSRESGVFRLLSGFPPQSKIASGGLEAVGDQSNLRRSGIFNQPEYVAPTELNDSLMALATDVPLLRSLEMAQGRVAVAPACAGARASARFTVRHAEPVELSGAPVLATLKRRERRAPAPAVATASWSAPAERSGDGAFVRTGREQTVEGIRSRESGVALPPALRYGAASRFPPQSKIALERLEAVCKQEVHWCAGVKPVKASQGWSKQKFDKIVEAAVSGAPSGRKNLSEFCTPSPKPSPQGEGFHAPSVFENTCDRMGGAVVLTDLGGRSEYAAPTELNNRSTGWATKISLLRSYEMGIENNPFKKN